MSRVTVRLATADDARALWAWRNDERTRAMSRDRGVVAWVDHRAWFEGALADPQRTIYIGTLPDGERVGMCRFDVDAASTYADVSLNVSPELRGRGLAQPLLAAAIAQFRETRSLPLHAVIRRENTASIRCFEHCGFVRSRTAAAYAFYVLVPAREDV
jgi:L-amino acid N-acyltransferase YncA